MSLNLRKSFLRTPQSQASAAAQDINIHQPAVKIMSTTNLKHKRKAPEQETTQSHTAQITDLASVINTIFNQGASVNSNHLGTNLSFGPNKKPKYETINRTLLKTKAGTGDTGGSLNPSTPPHAIIFLTQTPPREM
ncbi:hypothetical protein CHS0354_000906 [Potamilus streckersoni]|uniref:Uncharacterized protein n=1 Tax=Potamilus streckersoni TaxID=2493646 RepID=A0AAE0VRI1_9BIVA|nr:hypothetical protein CHS0354_000906 [Potamilus streckersoni]